MIIVTICSHILDDRIYKNICNPTHFSEFTLLSFYITFKWINTTKKGWENHYLCKSVTLHIPGLDCFECALPQVKYSHPSPVIPQLVCTLQSPGDSCKHSKAQVTSKTN